MASELKIASALGFDRRSPASSSWCERAPEDDRADLGEQLVRRASSGCWPPPWRSAGPCRCTGSTGACGRSTRTRSVAGFAALQRAATADHGCLPRRSYAERQPRSQPAGEAGRADGGLDRGGCRTATRCQVTAPIVGIEHEIRRARIAVARLPDAAGVDQRPVGVEVEALAVSPGPTTAGGPPSAWQNATGTWVWPCRPCVGLEHGEVLERRCRRPRRIRGAGRAGCRGRA